MAENQEPDVARRLGGGGNRQGVSGSGERVAATLKGAFKDVADYAAKAYKSLSDMEKVVDRLNQKVRSGGMGGAAHGSAATAGKANAGGASFGGARSPFGGTPGTVGGTGAGPGGGGGMGGHLNLGLAGFGGGGGGGPGGGGGAAAATAAGAPGGAGGGGMAGGNLISGGLGKMGGAGQIGAAVFKAAGAYGKAHLQDAATMELASSRLNIAGGSGANREYWRGAGSGLARMGGYNLDDNTAAALTLSNQGTLATGGQGVFGQYQSQVQQYTNQFGGLGAASAAQFVGQARSTQAIYAGRRMGIQTTGPGGVALPADQIARNLLKRYRGKAAVGSDRYQQDIAASLDQGGGLSNTIGSLGLGQEQQDMLTQDVQLLSQGKDPTKDGPKNKLDSQTKDTAQSQLETTSQTAKGIADGAADIKHAGEIFRGWVNKLIRGTHSGDVVGGASGGIGQIGGPAMRSAVPNTGLDSQKGGPAPQWQQIEDAVHKLGFSFGTPTSGQIGLNRGYGDHGAGRAVDFGDSSSDSAGIARALVPYATGPNAAISQLIYSPLNIGYDSGVNKGEKFYGAKTWAEHRNHVHVAVKPGVDLAAVVAAGPGSMASGTGAADSSAATAGPSGARSAGLVNSAGALINEGQISASEGLTGDLLAASPGASSASKSSTASAATGTGAGAGGAAPAAVGPLQDYAKKLLAQYGWSDQWDSFNKLEMSEAGWDPTISNGGGHGPPQHNKAYGIPQALPPEKMASAGADWATSGYTQLRWMMEYIKTKGSFHDPNSAWAYHQRNNSYAQGSWEIERDQYARIHAGEMIVPRDQATQIRSATGGRGGGSTVNLTVNVASASEAEVSRLIQRVKTELQRDSVLDAIGAS